MTHLYQQVARCENFGPERDVDVMVEFEPGRVPGLAFIAMEAELSEILGRKVDLNTPAATGGASVKITDMLGEEILTLHTV